VLDQYVI